MRPVVGFPQFNDVATVSFFEDWFGEPELVPMLDLRTPSRVYRGDGNAGIGWDLNGAPVTLVTLVNHTLAAGAQVTLTPYKANGSALPSTVVFSPPRARRMASCLPILVTGSPSRIEVEISNAGPFQVAGFSLSGMWEWPGISPGRELGFTPNGSAQALPGGASDPPAIDWLPRSIKGVIDYVDPDFQRVALDFMRVMDKDKPFVFIQDLDTPASWARTAWLATNGDLNPLVGAMYRHDQFPFGFVEHMR